MEARELLRELKRTVDELQAFNEIGKALTSTLEIREVLKLIMEKVGELLHPSNFSLLLLDDARKELSFEIAIGAGADKLRGVRFPLGEGIAGWVAREGKPLLVPEVANDPRFAARFDESTRFTTRSVLAVPLSVRGKTLGLIELVNGPLAPSFREDDLRTLSSIADYAAIALENARNFQMVRELTVTDDHTGLFNARHLHRALEVEVARARRFGHPLSLVFFDLDHFKQVNDQHGHQVGSALLSEVGVVMREVLRNIDTGVRYGGDEFVCVLPETTKEAALTCAGRLRETMRGRTFLAAQGLSLHLTASFGVATFPADAASDQELLKAADLAMYRAKAHSRDSVEAA